MASLTLGENLTLGDKSDSSDEDEEEEEDMDASDSEENFRTPTDVIMNKQTNHVQ